MKYELVEAQIFLSVYKNLSIANVSKVVCGSFCVVPASLHQLAAALAAGYITIIQQARNLWWQLNHGTVFNMLHYLVEGSTNTFLVATSLYYLDLWRVAQER